MSSWPSDGVKRSSHRSQQSVSSDLSLVTIGGWRLPEQKRTVAASGLRRPKPLTRYLDNRSRVSICAYWGTMQRQCVCLAQSFHRRRQHLSRLAREPRRRASWRTMRYWLAYLPCRWVALRNWHLIWCSPCPPQALANSCSRTSSMTQQCSYRRTTFENHRCLATFLTHYAPYVLVRRRSSSGTSAPPLAGHHRRAPCRRRRHAGAHRPSEEIRLLQATGRQCSSA